MGVRDEEEQDDLELEVEEDETDEAEESEPEEADDQEIDPDEDEPEEDEEERVVVIGDEEPDEEPEEAPGWVKKVRKVNRKLESENKRLKRELEQRSTAAQQEAPPVELGEKPTLKSVGYDDKKYEQALASYYDRKRQVDQYEAEKAKKLEDQQKQWQERQQRYVTQKEAHGFKDYEEAEELVSNTFNMTQQGILIQGAEDSALVVYALGKNPKKLEELAKESDPVNFAFKVAKLESQLKVTNKKAPSPEKRVKGAKAGGLSGTEDKTLERLRKEAEKTGDYTKVTQYKRKKRNK
jgi:hypothetical protein